MRAGFPYVKRDAETIHGRFAARPSPLATSPHGESFDLPASSARCEVIQPQPRDFARRIGESQPECFGGALQAIDVAGDLVFGGCLTGIGATVKSVHWV